jgi:hypothetical protein
MNPFAYLLTNDKAVPFPDEASYNAAMVQRCLAEGIEVVALTDHHRVRESYGLAMALEAAEITVLPGFEATASNSGAHVLMIFPEGTAEDYINLCISRTGVASYTDGSSTAGTMVLSDLLQAAKEWGALAIPAHIEDNNGLLRQFEGDDRMAAWLDPQLVAVAVAKPLQDLDPAHLDIIHCRPAEYRRIKPAVVAAKDVNGPEDLAHPGAWTYLKMTAPGFEGVAQALLDPDARILRRPDEPSHPGAHVMSIAWTGGFLDGEEVRLNPGMNVLIGGRGTGKTTVIESLRFALDLPTWGADDRRDFVEGVLGPGGEVTLRLSCTSPAPAELTVTRAVGASPVVRDAAGAVTALDPGELLPGIQIFGQRELAELASDAARRDGLIMRFVQESLEGTRREQLIGEALRDNREQHTSLDERLEDLVARVDTIPSVEARIAQISEAGLDDRVEHKKRLDADKRTLDRAVEEIERVANRLTSLANEIPTDLAYLEGAAREGRPASDLLARAEEAMARLQGEANRAVGSCGSAVESAREALVALLAEVSTRVGAAEDQYNAALRDLEEKGVDARDYVPLGAQLERLYEAKDEVGRLQRSRETLMQQRADLLDERDELADERWQQKKSAAKLMRRRLGGRADVIPRRGADRRAVVDLLRQLDGRTGELAKIVELQADLDVRALAKAAREGVEAVRSLLPGVPVKQAEILVACSDNALMQIEEAISTDTVDVRLNLKPYDNPPEYVDVERLSTGQKATAMLLVTLLDAGAPLAIDQPEDDLDNEFIAESLVPLIRAASPSRQLIFSSHNANIPVLGDADLVIPMTAQGSATTGGHGRPHVDAAGSIDDAKTRAQIERVLEGGREAFERRRRRYGR